MSEKYVPQVGDRIRLGYWDKYWIDVKFIDGDSFFGRWYGNGTANLYTLDLPWIKVEKPRPLPERWLRVDRDGVVVWVTKSAKARVRERNGRDIYRIWSDADGTPRIEQVTP